MFLEPQTRTIVAPFLPELQKAVPHAKRLTWDGRDWLLVPHRQDEARVLTNLGLDVPEPIMTYYDWRGGSPFQSQQDTAAMLVRERRAYCLSEMGTGKTRSGLYGFDWLRRSGLARRMLVVAPLSTLLPVWETEVFLRFPGLRVSVLHGTAQRRLQRLQEDADIYVINHDGVGVVLKELAARVTAGDIEVVLIDELSAFRSRSNRWRALSTLVARSKWAWGFTGSPMPKSPMDVYWQARLLTPHTVPPTQAAWEARTMLVFPNFVKKPKPGAREEAWKVLQPAIRFTRDEVVELPETSYVDRDVALSPTQSHVYAALERHFVAQIQNGQITAVNEAVARNKLLQVACGWVYADGRVATSLGATARMDALVELFEQIDDNRKMIVYVPFIHAAQGVHAELLRRGIQAELVYGDTSKTERDRIFMDFQHNPVGARILVAHPKTMSHGLTLTAANTIAWWSPVDCLETYAQANARITRPGQTAKTLVAHIRSTKLEGQVYQRLARKEALQGALLDMFT